MHGCTGGCCRATGYTTRVLPLVFCPCEGIRWSVGYIPATVPHILRRLTDDYSLLLVIIIIFVWPSIRIALGASSISSPFSLRMEFISFSDFDRFLRLRELYSPLRNNSASVIVETFVTWLSLSNRPDRFLAGLISP